MDISRVQAIAAAAVEAGASSAPVHATTIPGSVLLIDGDGFNYSCAGNDDTSPGWARTRLTDRINGLVQATGAERVILELTYPSSNKRLRYAIATVKPYQGKRASHRPKNWQFLRDWLESQPNSVSWGDREADDGIALHAYEYRDTGKVFIASADKDMRMIPGTHVHLETYEQVVVEPDTWELWAADKLFGRKWFYCQMLMGDSVDNIPGLEKTINAKGNAVLCGEKTALTLLQWICTPEEAVSQCRMAYQDFYGESGNDRMIEQAALLWLSTDADAKQWVPPEFLGNAGLREALHRLDNRLRNDAMSRLVGA